jgi:hypothetical protein
MVMSSINGALTTELERALAVAAATLRLAGEIHGALAGNPECLWRGSR